MIAGTLTLVMVTWYQGRGLVDHVVRASMTANDDVTRHTGARGDTPRLPGTAICLTRVADGTPLALRYLLTHLPALHECVVLLTLETTERPYEKNLTRVSTTWLGHGFVRVVGRFGFMETPDVARVLRLATDQGLAMPAGPQTYLVSRETILAARGPGMALWREELFAFMARSARGPAAFFGVPADRVLEVGVPVSV